MNETKLFHRLNCAAPASGVACAPGWRSWPARSALRSRTPIRLGKARFHDELARNHYQAGRFELALREFFLEQRISPNPRIAFNIALCFQGLERNEEAFQFLGEYLASDDTDTERRGYAERAVASMERSLALVRVESGRPSAASLARTQR